jgi:hypothetical protein
VAGEGWGGLKHVFLEFYCFYDIVYSNFVLFKKLKGTVKLSPATAGKKDGV